MAIDLPNEVVAAGMIQPVNSRVPPGLTPILSARGLLPFDAATTDNAETFTGGFARFSTGLYGMKWLEGLDVSEGVAWAQSIADYSALTIVPQLPDLVGTSMGDGRSGFVVVVDPNGQLVDPFGGFTFRVTRFTSQPVDLDAVRDA